MEFQSELTHISSYTSKLLRQKFGRGPKACTATFSQNYLVLYINGFISPMEEVLLQQGKGLDVNNARVTIITHVLEELKGVVQVTLNVEVTDCFNDWNFYNNTGVLVLITSGMSVSENEKEIFALPQFETEIARISELVQKAPDKLEVICVSERFLIAKREGILIQIEKALLAKGFEKELLLTKDELEKKYFHRYGKFDQILARNVSDIFIDWNLKENKSIMVFVLT